MSGEEREDVVWTAFEKRHLLREFRAGKKVADLASVHKRKKITLRKALIDLGAVDPVDDEIKPTLKGVYHQVIEQLSFGQQAQKPERFPRDCLAWTAGEIALLAESYKEGLSTTALARIHQRHPVSILAPIYENCDSGLFEKTPESSEEAWLRYQRLREYQESARMYCDLGAFSVEEVVRREVMFYEIDLRNQAYDEYDEDEGSSGVSSHQPDLCSWPDDAGTEWWEHHMGGPDDDVLERLLDPPPCDDPDADFYRDDFLVDFESSEESVQEQPVPDKYANLEFFEFKSAFETTTIGALARITTEEFFEVETIFLEYWGERRELKSAVTGEKFSSVLELQDLLTEMSVKYFDE